MIDLISRLCDLINHHRERRTWRGFAWNWSVWITFAPLALIGVWQSWREGDWTRWKA